MGRVDRLTDALLELPIVSAYLFGSQANDSAGPLSDVDIAILPDEGVNGEERLLLRGKVATRAAAVFDTENADVVLIDEAPPRIAFQALQGTLLLDRDPETRVRLEARIQSAYHDRQYHDQLWERAMLDRYKSGSSP